ncbi:MAG: aldehyde-activating protein [Kordiimonadales bacterium]|nr:MAG: aldehyde-activating protein [Kordiimonadales bacterium]
MENHLSGSCLCGAVSYTVSAEPTLAVHCACVACRKSSGTSHSTHVPMAADAVKISGELKSYETQADSGNRILHHFCPNCSSSIYNSNADISGMMFLRASSLDNPDAISPSVLVYASRAPKWASCGEGLAVFDEMPPTKAADMIKESQNA